MMEVEVVNRCKYFLPCGICDKTNKPCTEDHEPIIAPCAHEWLFYKNITDPNEMKETIIFKCSKCGNTKTSYRSHYPPGV